MREGPTVEQMMKTGERDPLKPLETYLDQIDAHPVTLRRWVHRDGLKAAKLGGKLYVRQSDFDAFVAERMVGAGA